MISKANLSDKRPAPNGHGAEPLVNGPFYLWVMWRNLKKEFKMTVNQLIARLRAEQKAGNGKLVVGYSHGDNSEHEVAGWCIGLQLLEKADYYDINLSTRDRECLDSLPDAIIVIRG